MGNRVIHFEIQASDVERAVNFYESTFGWKIKQMMNKNDGGMDYWVIDTGEGFGINGGLYKRPRSKEKRFYLYDCTIEVPDIDEAVAAVKANGGLITKGIEEIPGVGLFAGALDTEENRFGIMQSTDWVPK